MIVERRVHRGRVDRDVRMRRVDACDALGRREQAGELDVPGARRA